VYGVGRYFIGPDFEFKIFPADLHYVEVEDAKIFTSDKLEVSTYIARASKRMFAGGHKEKLLYLYLFVLDHKETLLCL
jgi:hypothetical protein